MAEYKATSEQWALLQRQSQTLGSAESMALLELRARVEALEAAQPKQITQEELAKLLAQPARVVPLATATASSLVERVADGISKPLQLTPEQAQQINDLLAPNSKSTPNPSQIRSSLVERVAWAVWGYDAPENAARAAIREVAAWLKETHGWSDGLLMRLEQEAER